ncbi:MAG: hypothetical protein GDA67_12660 [Nitrospira sp. CR1.3]|nr:hypothetical protein [Nitrospira sp. CR1.3]
MLTVMNGIPKASFRRFSIAMIVALFFCQVIGIVCPMVIPAMPLQTTLSYVNAEHSHHASHVMDDGRSCPDSLVSSPDPSDTISGHVPSGILDIPIAIAPVPAVAEYQHEAVPRHDPGLPLYALLSTFRI